MDYMELSRPEYWNGSPFPSPGDLPNPGFEPRSPALQADSLSSEPPVPERIVLRVGCVLQSHSPLLEEIALTL